MSWPLASAGIIFISMGVVHGLATLADVLFRPTQFTPVDDSVRLAMKATRIRFFKARANMWDAWLGFNISHSISLAMFGSFTLWLGLNPFHMTQPLWILLISISALYFILSIRFWFFVPAVLSTTATACLVVGWRNF